MKTRTISMLSAGVALAALPLVGGDQESTSDSTGAAIVMGNPATFVEPADSAEVPSPEQVEQDLENAPGRVVSFAAPPASINLSAPSAEVAKLAQAGVEESVMLAFVTNSPYVFRLDADDIVYLNDVGVSGTVVAAMIQHDQLLDPTIPQPINTNTTMMAEVEVPQPEVVATGQPAEQVNVSYTYFYDSLAPYGSWININGYGLCWQPTAVVVNRGWRPYCDRGRWVYSDCGWYWASEYSWGWAPYHYGRWFNHARWGWCWAPDTVWGPSWVTWRYNRDHCAWAPLPPTACFTPGIGFTYYRRPVHATFAFGLSAKHFTCVPVTHFSERHLDRHRISEPQAQAFFRSSLNVNTIMARNRTVVNEGISPSHVAAVTHREIRSVRLRDTGVSGRPGPAGRSEQFDRDGRSIGVFRPNLPEPTQQTSFVGRGVKPARSVTVSRTDRLDVRNADSATSRQQFGTANNNNNSPGRERQLQTEPVSRNQTPASPSTQTETRSDTVTRDSKTPTRGNQVPPLILRGPATERSQRTDRGVLTPGIVPAPAPVDPNRSTTTPRQPSPPTIPPQSPTPTPTPTPSTPTKSPPTIPPTSPTPAPRQPSPNPITIYRTPQRQQPEQQPPPQQQQPPPPQQQQQPQQQWQQQQQQWQQQQPRSQPQPRPQSSVSEQDIDRSTARFSRSDRSDRVNVAPSRQETQSTRQQSQRDSSPAPVQRQPTMSAPQAPSQQRLGGDSQRSFSRPEQRAPEQRAPEQRAPEQRSAPANAFRQSESRQAPSSQQRESSSSRQNDNRQNDSSQSSASRQNNSSQSSSSSRQNNSSDSRGNDSRQSSNNSNSRSNR